MLSSKKGASIVLKCPQTFFFFFFFLEAPKAIETSTNIKILTEENERIENVFECLLVAAQALMLKRQVFYNIS